MKRLAHFSEDPNIAEFHPRPVKVAVERPPGQDWLNGPLVWAIDDDHEMLYFFPRECPRIVIWPTSKTTERDRAHWFPDPSLTAIAYIELGWLERLQKTEIYRYNLPPATFVEVGEIGMSVSQTAVKPTKVDCLSDLPTCLDAKGVALCTLDSLLPLEEVWQTSLHASGIRLRNAAGWGDPGWPHSRPERIPS